MTGSLASLLVGHSRLILSDSARIVTVLGGSPRTPKPICCRSFDAIATSQHRPFDCFDTQLHNDGVYEIDIESTGAAQADGLPIRRVLPMLAVIAETALTVRQLDENTIECVTGMLDDDGPYAAHGHLIRLRIRS